MIKHSTYISSVLQQKLNHMIVAPVSIVIAPGGYGKTTALLAMLEDVPLENKLAEARNE